MEDSARRSARRGPSRFGSSVILIVAVGAMAGLSGIPGAGAQVPSIATNSSVSISDAPGNVYYASPPKSAVASPTSDPADLTYASASDDGTIITLTAKTVALNDPTTDPNWLGGDTYIGWDLDTTSSGAPKYGVYFQMNPDGSFDGELTYVATDTPVSCVVDLSYNATVGYQASLASACLAGATSFQWFAYSNYDTVSRSVDPDGHDAFGKSLPDAYSGGSQFGPAVTAPQPATPAASTASSYWLFARDGGVFSFHAPFFGSVPGAGAHVNNLVGGTATLDRQGYWLVGSDGGIFAFGDARFYGSMGGRRLVAPVTGVSPVPTGTGYWEVASDGGIFSFGDAGFYGSMGGRHLVAPVVGMASPDRGGYWLFASDGGVFAFGDAGYYGSMGGTRLVAPIVAGTATPDGKGYWLVASDGGIFSFGDAKFYGSMGGTPLAGAVVGMVPTADGMGYWLDASDGGVFSFGDAPFLGSLGGRFLADPVIAMAVSR